MSGKKIWARCVLAHLLFWLSAATAALFLNAPGIANAALSFARMRAFGSAGSRERERYTSAVGTTGFASPAALFDCPVLSLVAMPLSAGIILVFRENKKRVVVWCVAVAVGSAVLASQIDAFVFHLSSSGAVKRMDDCALLSTEVPHFSIFKRAFRGSFGGDPAIATAGLFGLECGGETLRAARSVLFPNYTFDAEAYAREWVDVLCALFLFALVAATLRAVQSFLRSFSSRRSTARCATLSIATYYNKIKL